MATAVKPRQRAAETPKRAGRNAPADVIVIFGITGDLAKVMTFRSLYRLEVRGLLGCPIVGVAVDDWTVEDLIQHAVIDIRLRWRVEQQPPGPVGGIASPLELGDAARIEGPNGDDDQDGDVLQPGHEWIIAGYGRRPWEGSRLACWLDHERGR